MSELIVWSFCLLMLSRSCIHHLILYLSIFLGPLLGIGGKINCCMQNGIVNLAEAVGKSVLTFYICCLMLRSTLGLLRLLFDPLLYDDTRV